MHKPELYMNMGLIQLPTVKHLLEKHVKKFPWNNEECILDVGCGTGNVSTTLILPVLPDDAKLVGIDMSKEMIEFAKKNFSHNRIEYKVMDIQRKLTSEWQSESFDKVLSFFTFHFITDFRKAAENLSHLLKRDGYLFIQLVSKHPFNTALENLEKQSSWSSYLKETDMSLRMLHNCSDPCEFLNKYFISSGFNVMTSYAENHQGHFPDMTNLMNLFRSICPLTAKVPADKLEECCSLIKEELLKHESIIVTETGEVKITWENIIIVAKKI